MQYQQVAKAEIDLSKAQEELRQLILLVSLSQPDQLGFFKDLDLWMGETTDNIEQKMANQQDG